jgi:hypothetical protein
MIVVIFIIGVPTVLVLFCMVLNGAVHYNLILLLYDGIKCTRDILVRTLRSTKGIDIVCTFHRFSTGTCTSCKVTLHF